MTEPADSATDKPVDQTRRDGFASMAILALTVLFIVIVLVALI